MYSKVNGTHGPHCWIPEAHIVTELSHILLQLYWWDGLEDTNTYSSFSEKWNLSKSKQAQLNKRYCLLTSASLLCIVQEWVRSERGLHLHNQANTLFCSIQHNITQIQAAAVEIDKKLWKGWWRLKILILRTWFPYIRWMAPFLAYSTQSCRLIWERITIFGNFSNLPNPHPNFELPHHTPTENHPNWGRNFEKVDPNWASKSGKKFSQFHVIIQGSCKNLYLSKKHLQSI